MRRKVSGALVVVAISMLLVGTLSSQFSLRPLHGFVKPDGEPRILESYFSGDGWAENSRRGGVSELSGGSLSGRVDPILEEGILRYGSGSVDFIVVDSEVLGEVGVPQSDSDPLRLEPEKLIRIVVNPDGSLILQIFHLSESPLAEDQSYNTIVPIQ